jgi:hypothetical protein
MTEIISETSKSVTFACDYCGTHTTRKRCEYMYKIRQGIKKIRNIHYCSIECGSKDRKEKAYPQYKCEVCKEDIIRTRSKMPKSGRIFCSSSCAARYNNKNKKTGIRKSKNELLLLLALRWRYPDLTLLSGDRQLLSGLELDIVIKELNLAIEYNGIIHYQPIYGDTLLERTKRRDELKSDLCSALGIRLITVKESKLSPTQIVEVFKQCCNIIDELISTLRVDASRIEDFPFPKVQDLVTCGLLSSEDTWKNKRRTKSLELKNLPIGVDQLCSRGCNRLASVRDCRGNAVCKLHDQKCRKLAEFS